MSYNHQISNKKPLNHVAVIMDGNGRWATKKGFSRAYGHQEGAKAIKIFLKAADKESIKYITLFAFSTENNNRPSDEIKNIMKIINIFIFKYTFNIIKNKICFKVIGEYRELSKDIINKVDYLIEKTKYFTSKTLILALNYSSRIEIIQSIKKYINEVLDKKENISLLNWNIFSKFLYTSDIPDPDLIIRTSGESRLSNFLLMQSAYAEIYFTKTLWPDFNELEFNKAVDFYYSKERRFGTIENTQS